MKIRINCRGIITAFLISDDFTAKNFIGGGTLKTCLACGKYLCGVSVKNLIDRKTEVCCLPEKEQATNSIDRFINRPGWSSYPT
jgi:hypothetical protein